GYEGMQIALPSEYMPVVPMENLAQRLLELARNIQPRQVAKSPRGPKVLKAKAWAQGTAVHAHVSTDRVIKAAKTKRP
ncbi:IS4 family transposase, partial [Pseudomonas sp. yb_5]